MYTYVHLHVPYTRTVMCFPIRCVPEWSVIRITHQSLKSNAYCSVRAGSAPDDERGRGQRRRALDGRDPVRHGTRGVRLVARHRLRRGGAVPRRALTTWPPALPLRCRLQQSQPLPTIVALPSCGSALAARSNVCTSCFEPRSSNCWHVGCWIYKYYISRCL